MACPAALPLSPERRARPMRPKRSASLNRSSLSLHSLAAEEAPAPAPSASRRMTKGSWMRNRSQISLHGYPQGPEQAGQSADYYRPMRRAASAAPRSSLRSGGQLGEASTVELARRSSRRPSFEPPPRQKPSEEASTTDPSSQGSKGASDASSTREGKEASGHAEAKATTANIAARVAARFSDRPAGVTSASTALEDTFIQSPDKRHRKEAPIRPCADGMAGRASNCWVQEPRPSKWQGPSPPLRAENLSLHRGSQALPSGRMSLRKERTTSADYGRAYTLRQDAPCAGVPSPHATRRAPTPERRNEARAKCLYITSHKDYGNMYQKMP